MSFHGADGVHVDGAGQRLCDSLSRFGDALAAIDDDGRCISYSELILQADAQCELIGPERRLLLLEGSNTIPWLIAYVAGLRGRHPMLIVPGVAATMDALEAEFRPSFRLLAANGYQPEQVPGGGGMRLHPDLAVLLSTSGSTGSTKCVRLSASNIAANAASIAAYLDIDSDHRGAANLPTHYSYGLSIVNSHLHVGAALLLTSRSVTDRAFWSLLQEHRATSFAGVPHVYDLLERIDFAGSAPATLRYFTQAGGRLSPESVRQFGQQAERLNARFYVMYGQTEATARIAYLPPERLADHPDCIGVAIPGGRLTLVDESGAEIAVSDQDGELIYHGPNVMMGYAKSFTELEEAAGPPQLATGDIARRTTDGLFRITGRRSRFVKIFGNRLGLDEIERLLSEAGHPAIATGVDDQLLVVTRESNAVAPIAELLTKRLKLPRAYYEVRTVQEYPLLTSGKIDYAGLKASLVHPLPKLSRWWRPEHRTSATTVPAVFAAVFGEAAAEETATFNSLGGDSLNYVLVVTGLDALIPELPEDWETLSIGALTAKSVPTARPETASRMPANVDTLRGFACLLVVAYHVIGYNAVTGLRLPLGSAWHYASDSFDYVRMPMFTAFAGMIYAAMPATRDRFGAFITRKGRQILVPLLFATLVVWGMRRAAYGGGDSLILAYRDGYQHLWYLHALMLMFVIAALGDTLVGQSWRGWAVALLTVIVVRPWLPHISLFAITNMLHLLPFFITGMLLYRSPVVLRSTRVLAAAIITAVGLLAVQQATMLSLVNIGEAWRYLEYACSGAIIVAALRLAPTFVPLERLAAYSYTIYLWHPTANALARTILVGLGIKALWVLFLLGMVAATLGPITLHLIMLRLPRLSLPVIGR